MFRPGHYGVALVLYAPAGCALLAHGDPTVAFAGGAALLWLTMLPDWDSWLPVISHRGPTHTLAFAALVAVGAWAVTGGIAEAVGLSRTVGPLALPTFAAGIGALAILAHLAADLLTPMGVAVLWPATRRRYSVSLTTADSAVWNYALFALGIFTTLMAAYLGTTLFAGHTAVTLGTLTVVEEVTFGTLAGIAPA